MGMSQEIRTAYVGMGDPRDHPLARRLDRRRRRRAADREVAADWPTAVPHDPVRVR